MPQQSNTEGHMLCETALRKVYHQNTMPGMFRGHISKMSLPVLTKTTLALILIRGSCNIYRLAVDNTVTSRPDN